MVALALTNHTPFRICVPIGQLACEQRRGDEFVCVFKSVCLRVHSCECMLSVRASPSVKVPLCLCPTASLHSCDRLFLSSFAFS